VFACPAYRLNGALVAVGRAVFGGAERAETSPRCAAGSDDQAECYPRAAGRGRGRPAAGARASQAARSVLVQALNRPVKVSAGWPALPWAGWGRSPGTAPPV